MATSKSRASTDVATRVATSLAPRAATALDLSESVRVYLEEAGRTGAVAIATLEDAERLFRQHQQSETASRVMQGWVLASVKAMGEESLRALSTRVGSNPETVRQLIAYFNLFQVAPDLDSVRRCGHLEFTIARTVAKWPLHQQIAFCGGEEVRGVTIEQARDMTSREFIARAKPPEIAALEVENAKLRAAVTLAEKKRDLIARAGASLEVEGEMPPFARAPRHETFAFNEATSFLLDNLEALYNEHLLSDVKHPEAHRFQPVVASNVYAVLGAVQGRIATLRERIRAAYPNSVGDSVTLDHQLSPHESAVLADRCERMKFAFRQQAQKRSEDRANSQVGRRGRTQGS